MSTTTNKLWKILRRSDNEQPNVGEIQKKLGWSNSQFRIAAEDLLYRRKIRNVVNTLNYTSQRIVSSLMLWSRRPA
jgi:hypothetical protein